MRISLGMIAFDAGTQIRAALDQQVVSRLRRGDDEWRDVPADRAVS
jgi:hypothetical protein